MTRVLLELTHQQMELLNASLAAGEAEDLDALVNLALLESSDGIVRRALPMRGGRESRWRDDVGFTPATDRVLRWEHRLEPGTGKAVEVHTGQIVRIEQIDGNQCADLNVFNLHDYREVMHVGRTRTLHGIHPGQGDLLWSAPPRERAMMLILTDTAGLNDTLFPRCSANMYESLFGFPEHTNCADIQAEAQREYGLTPDDVHDSFNLFMGTRVNADGGCEVLHQQTAPGDHVELLALMDLLVVPNVCGNDIFSTSNHSLRPLALSLSDASRDDIARVPSLRSYATQRTPADFTQPVIRAERSLTRDPEYTASFPRTPVTVHEVEIALDDSEAALLAAHVRRDLHGADGEVLRDVVISWWVSSHA